MSGKLKRLQVRSAAARLQSSTAARTTLAIVGASCRLPSGAESTRSVRGVDEFGAVLEKGTDCIGKCPAIESAGTRTRFAGGFLADVDQFDAEFFDISPREARDMDPQQRLLTTLAFEALEDAGLTPSSLKSVGVFVGIWNHDYERLQSRRRSAVSDGGNPGSPYFATGNSASVAAGRLSYTFGFEGPCVTVDTACSSSLAALHLARQSLLLGECSVAVVAGVNLLLGDELTEHLGAANMLAADSRCKTFDEAADGYVRGEAGVALVLRRTLDADGDNIRGLLHGTAINHDGRSASLTAPNGLAQQSVILSALEQAGLSPDAIDMLEAHGTGTKLGDPIEIGALVNVFATGSRSGETPLIISAVKANVGHSEACAGLVGVVKCLAALQRGRIPPQIHVRSLNPLFSSLLDRVPAKVLMSDSAHDWSRRDDRPRLTGVSSFGFSGTNVHAIIGEVPAPMSSDEAASSDSEDADGKLFVFAVSNNTHTGLVSQAQLLKETFRRLPGRLHDICASTVRSRDLHSHRACFIVSSAADAIQCLDDLSRHSNDLLAQHNKFRPHRQAAENGLELRFGPTRFHGPTFSAMCDLFPAFRERFEECVGVCSEIGFSLPTVNDLVSILSSHAPLLAVIQQMCILSVIEAWRIPIHSHCGSNIGKVVVLYATGQISMAGAMRKAVSASSRSRQFQFLRVNGSLSEEAESEAKASLINSVSDVFVVARLISEHSVVIAVPNDHLDKVRAKLATSSLVASTATRSYAAEAAEPVEEPTTTAGDQLVFVNVAGSVGRGAPAASALHVPFEFGCRRCLLELLCELVHREIEPDWRRVCGDYNKVRLPRYVWSPRNFWFDQKPSDQRWLFDPQPIIKSDSTDEHIFKVEISLEKHSFLADHSVLDIVVLPFTAYIEIALECLASATGGNRTPTTFQLTNFEVHKAMILVPKKPIEITVKISTTDNIIFQSVGSDRYTSTQYKLSWDSLVNDTFQVGRKYVPATPFDYETFRKHGLTYGKEFQPLSSHDLVPNENVCFSWLGRKARFDEKHVSDPRILDGVLQTVLLSLISGIDSTFVLLPIAIREIRLYSENFHGCWEGLCRATKVSSSPEYSVGSAVIGLSQNGTVCFFEDISIRHTTARVLSTRLRSSNIDSSTSRSGGSTIYLVDDENADVAASSTKQLHYGVLLADGPALAFSIGDTVATIIDPSVLLDRLSGASLDGIVVVERRPAAVSLILKIANALTSAARLVQYVVFALSYDASSVEAISQLANWTGVVEALRAEQASIMFSVCTFEAGTDESTMISESMCLADRQQQSRRGRGAVSLDSHVRISSGKQRSVQKLKRHSLTTATQAISLEQSLWRVDVKKPGVLDSLDSHPLERIATIDAHEVEVEVFASGINFKDVLVALKYVERDGDLGLECSGRITRIGTAVSSLAVGDVVFGLAIGTYQSHCVTHEKLLAKVPEKLCAIEAASVPVVFATVLYSLECLAKIKRGETVLVHAAAGGVGMAAIQVCLRAGATVFGSAGTSSKRALIRSLGVTHVLNSRSLKFREDIDDITGGHGVDVVLNSLNGDFARASLACVRKNGRFVEIGKAGIMTPEDVAASRPDVAYHVVYLVDQMRRDRDTVQRLLVALAKGFADGSLAPIRTTVVPMQRLLTAFRFMKQGKHIGKLVAFSPAASASNARLVPLFPAETSVLISGGLGALGLVMARFFSQEGATHIFLLGRRGPPEDTGVKIEEIRADFGVCVEWLRCDVSTASDVESVLSAIAERKAPPLRVVVHCAGVLDDGILSSQTVEKFATACRPKITGALALHTSTVKIGTVSHFLLFSSIVSLLGASGQASYAVGNCFLNHFARLRSSVGLPATSLCWGPWKEVGMAANAAAHRIFQRKGFTPLPTAVALSMLRDYLAAMEIHNVVGMFDVDWRQYAKTVGSLLGASFFANVFENSDPTSARLATSHAPAQRQEIRARPKQQQVTDARNSQPSLAAAKAVVQSTVRTALGTGHDVDPFESFASLGVDSLMSVEIRNGLAAATGLELSATVVFDHPTVARLAAYIASLQDPGPASPTPATTPTVSGGVDTHAESKIRKTVMDLFGLSEMDEFKSFSEMGMDSLMAVELRNSIAEILGRELSATLLFDYPTLNSLITHLCPSETVGDASPNSRETIGWARLQMRRRKPEQRFGTTKPAAQVSRRMFSGDSVESHMSSLPRFSQGFAVVGIGCRFPSGIDTPEKFWAALVDGRDLVGESKKRWDMPPNLPDAMYHAALTENIDQFDSAFFGIAAREADSIDPQHRYALECAYEAIERAGISPRDLVSTRTGVFLGISSHDYFDVAHSNAVDKNSTYFATGNHHSCAAGRISYVLGLQGPCIAVDTACSSALVAVHLALQSLRDGECDAALVGGVNLIVSPGSSTATLQRLGMLSPDGRCHTFDNSANGYVRGEGCAMLLLLPTESAQRSNHSIIAVLRGSSVNQDGRSSGLTAPNGPSQERVIRDALTRANLAPNDIDFIETHGTGTKLGDPIEMTALKHVFGNQGRLLHRLLVLGAVKTNIGHLEAGAGAAGLVKLVLSLQKAKIPQNLHMNSLNEHLPSLDDVGAQLPSTTMEWPHNGSLRTGSVSSFGFSGTNAHVVATTLSNEEQEMTREVQRSVTWPAVVVPLSAKTSAALDSMIENLIGYLETSDVWDDGELDQRSSLCRLGDVSFTCALGRDEHKHRCAAVGCSRLGVLQSLQALKLQRVASVQDTTSALSRAQRGAVAFVFSSATTVRDSGLRGLRTVSEAYPDFKSRCERIDSELCRALNLPTGHLFEGGTELVDAQETRDIRVALDFAAQLACAEFWSLVFLEPQVLAADGVGWLASAVFSGLLSLRDASNVVAELTVENEVFAFELTGPITQESLESIEHIVPSSINAIRIDDIVIVTCRAVDRTAAQANVEQALERDDGRSRVCFLSAWYALRERSTDSLRSALESVDWLEETCPLLGELTASPTSDFVETFQRRLLHEARPYSAVFEACETELRNESDAVLDVTWISMSSDPSVAAIGDCISPGDWVHASGDTALQTSASVQFLAICRTVAFLYSCSVPVNWNQWYAIQGFFGHRLSLPTYPFQRKRHWFRGLGFPFDNYAAASQRAAASTSVTKSVKIMSDGSRDLRKVIQDAVSTVLSVDRVRDEFSLLEVGMDSLSAVELSANLSGALSVHVPPTAAMKHNTVASLTRYVQELINASASLAKRSTSTPSFRDIRERVTHQVAPDSMKQNESFVVRGLDSLAGVELSANLGGIFGVDLPPTTVLRHDTTESLSEEIHRRIMDRSSQEVADNDQSTQGIARQAQQYPLSRSQQAIWVACMLDKNRTDYNLSVSSVMAPETDLSLFEGAVQNVHTSNSILQSVVLDESDGEFPDNHWYEAGAPWRENRNALADYAVVDCTGWSRQSIYFELERIMLKPYNLANDSLIRYRVLVDQSSDLIIFHVAAHHVIVDAESLRKILEQARNVFHGSGVVLSDPSSRITEHIEESSVEFWEKYLSNSRLRPQTDSADLSGSYESVRYLSASQRERVYAFAKARDLTLPQYFLNVLAQHLWETWGDNGFAIGVSVDASVLHGSPARELGNSAELMPITVRSCLVVESLRNDIIDGMTHHIPIHIIFRGAQQKYPSVSFSFSRGSWPGHPFTQPIFVPQQRGINGLHLEVLHSDQFIRMSLSGNGELPFVSATALLERSLHDEIKTNENLGRQHCRELTTPYALPSHDLGFSAKLSRTALILDSDYISYKCMQERGSTIQSILVALCVRAHCRVALLMKRSIEFICCVWALNQIGASYVPIDPGYPKARRDFMYQESGAVLMIAGQRTSDEQKVMSLDVDWARISRESHEYSDLEKRTPRGSDEMYVIFTSGSTGRPKGVAISRCSLQNRIIWQKDKIQDTNSRILNKTSLCFDVSVWEIYQPIFSTSRTLVIAPPEAERDPWTLSTIIDEQCVTIVHFVPSMLNSLLSSDVFLLQRCSSLVYVVCSGEALPSTTTRTMLDRAPNTRVINLYGPTEATIDVSFFEMSAQDRDSDSSVPIGWPIWNTKLLVQSMVACDRLAPVGCGGQLLIGGRGLALGYVDRPRLTAEKFIPDWFDGSGGRLYQTGDVCVAERDGALRFIGRKDGQIKLRGFRVELGEIESAMRQLSDIVQDCAVAAVDRQSESTDNSDDRILVAFVVTTNLMPGTTEDTGASSSEPDAMTSVAKVLRTQLSTLLPAHMVPAHYVWLGRLPTTVNGKVDRRALPAAYHNHLQSSSVLLADEDAEFWSDRATDTEKELRAIWADLLRIAPASIRPSSNFFQLGGDSLLAMRLTSRLRALDQLSASSLTLGDVFGSPTLGDLAARIVAHISKTTASMTLTAAQCFGDSISIPELAVDRETTHTCRLSAAQKRFFVLEQFDDAKNANNMPASFLIQGKIEERALRSASSSLLQWHSVLRTKFASRINADGDHGTVVGIESFSDRFFKAETLSVDDDISESHRRAAFSRIANEEASSAFDLHTGPLIRVRLTFSSSETLLCITIHHSVADGWSVDLIARDLSRLYDSAVAGDGNATPRSRGWQYADYAEWEHLCWESPTLAPARAGLERFWREALDDGRVPALELPIDKVRPELQTFNGIASSIDLDERTFRAVQKMAQSQGMSTFMLLTACAELFLFSLSGQSDFAIGTPTAGRYRPEFEDIVGCFVNTLVLRSSVRNVCPDTTMQDFLQAVRSKCLASFEHERLPFDRLVDTLACVERDMARTPLFQAMIVLQNIGGPKLRSGDQLQLSGADVRRFSAQSGEAPPAKFELTFAFEESGSPDTGRTLTGALIGNADLIHPATLARWANRFRSLLSNIVCATNDLKHIKTFNSTQSSVGLLENHATTIEWNDSSMRAVDGEDILQHDATTEGGGGSRLHNLSARLHSHAQTQPDAVCVVCDDDYVSFNEVARRTKILADFLWVTGVRCRDKVVVCQHRSVSMIVSLMCILEIGAVYVPVDPAHPKSRAIYIEKDCSSRMTICDAVSNSPTVHRSVCLNTDWPTIISAACEPHPTISTLPHMSMYVIYTSGSTGHPKGVEVTLQSALDRLDWHRMFCNLNGFFRVLAKNSISFDVSIWEICVPLRAGVAVVCVRDDVLFDVKLLCQDTVRYQATVLNFVPQALREFVLSWKRSDECLRVIISGGDILLRTLADSVLHSCDVQLFNMYGPTEIVIECTGFAYCSLSSEASISVPVGFPASSSSCYIEKNAFEGELVVAGVLASHYVGKSGNTARQFIPNMFSTDGSRAYRTGDLCRRTTDGALEFLGRIDAQVKVRGYRIELGEVEAAVLRFGDKFGVWSCAAYAFSSTTASATTSEASPATTTQLVAYVVFAASTAEDTQRGRIDELRALLGGELPDYMIPSKFVVLDTLPLNKNGKVDRRALPEPTTVVLQGSENEAPVTHSERRLAALWRRILRLTFVSRRDNFFHVGGDSLSATRLVAELSQVVGVSLPLSIVFRSPVLEVMAEFVDETVAAQALPEAAGTDNDTFLIDMDLILDRNRAGDTRNASTEQTVRSAVVVLVPGADWLPPSLDELASAINDGAHVYAIDRPFGDCSDLTEVANACALAICSVLQSSHGVGGVTQLPLALVGYSSGGLLAFEIARLLQSTEFSPRSVILLESFVRCGLEMTQNTKDRIWRHTSDRWLRSSHENTDSRAERDDENAASVATDEADAVDGSASAKFVQHPFPCQTNLSLARPEEAEPLDWDSSSNDTEAEPGLQRANDNTDDLMSQSLARDLSANALRQLRPRRRAEWFALHRCKSRNSGAGGIPSLDSLLELHKYYVEVQCWHKELEARQSLTLANGIALVQFYTDTCPLWASTSDGFGWRSFAGDGGRTRMQRVEGDHSSMLRGPAVRAVSSCLFNS